MTHTGGAPKWEVLKDDTAPTKPNVFAQVSNDSTSGRFPLAIWEKASFKDGEAAYDQDNAKSKEAFQQAIAGYQQVIDAGFPALTSERKKSADAAKADADSVKAGVAVKSDYNAAQKLYDQAVAAAKAKDYPKALDLYEQSRARFAAAAQTTRDLKAKAEASIKEVKDELDTAEQQAAEAEKIREEGGL